MCVNFKPATPYEITSLFGVSNIVPWEAECWQDYAAPLIRKKPGSTEIELQIGTFGMVPQKRIEAGKRFTTMNARIETVGTLRSFKQAWVNRQVCLLPIQAFFEPCYESGAHVRWRIGSADHEVFTVAGLWREWSSHTDAKEISFTLLTGNVDSHSFLSRFHKPTDEKRSLFIIEPEKREQWLGLDVSDDPMPSLRIPSPDWYTGNERKRPAEAPKKPVSQSLIIDLGFNRGQRHEFISKTQTLATAHPSVAKQSIVASGVLP